MGCKVQASCGGSGVLGLRVFVWSGQVLPAWGLDQHTQARLPIQRRQAFVDMRGSQHSGRLHAAAEALSRFYLWGCS